MSALDWSDCAAIFGSLYGDFVAPCPICGPDRKSAYNQRRCVLKLWRHEEDFATYHCARCGVNGWVKPLDPAPANSNGALGQALPGRGHFERAHKEAALVRRQEEGQGVRAERSALAEFTYFSSDEIPGTPAERYLASRGYGPGANLRFGRFAPFSYAADRSGPAMVAAVRDISGDIIGCHVTHLTAHAAKLRRTMFGRVGGGAVQLTKVGEDGVLAIAEGIETALGFSALYGIPCWSALSAAGIAAFEPPPGLTRLVVAADYDEAGAGLKAAQSLAKRACQACEVVISLPARVGMDWDDAHRESQRGAA